MSSTVAEAACAARSTASHDNSWTQIDRETALNQADAKSVEELLASAMESSDLSLVLDRACDADKLIAAGLAGATPRLRGYSALFRARMGIHADEESLREAMLEIIRRTKRRAITQRWKTRSGFFYVWARAVLRYWLDDICTRCNGVKFEVEPGTHRLSARPCECCGGSGRKPYPVLSKEVNCREGMWRKRFHDQLAELDERNAEFRERMQRFLGRKVRPETE